MSKNKIPVILITGYLGSGKTTLMQNLLKQEQRKIALIVNDMGSVNIDAALLNKNRGRIASVEMVELQNGCICCTLRDEFIAEIERISQLPDIEDPLPFNINAPVVVIKDDDYAVWYSDIMNEAVKYHEKTVKFKAMIGSRPELPPNVFAVGRFIMTCCEADMEFCWFVAFYNRYHEVKGDIWALITAEITVQHHENENIDIPLLRITELYECAPPEIEIASF